MKRFILSLLVLVMFTPSLACAKFMDHQKTPQPHMTMMASAQGMPCCPEANQKSDAGTRLFKDCAKIDLQHVGDVSLLKKADSANVPYILPQVLTADNLAISKGLLMHGPPALAENFRSYPPVFLATQRLRI